MILHKTFFGKTSEIFKTVNVEFSGSEVFAMVNRDRDFHKIFQALLLGGRLLIRDFVMDESRTHPPEGALFALNMLVNTPGGDTYTFREIKHPLEQAGFLEVKIIQTCQQLMDCLVEAKKPRVHA